MIIAALVCEMLLETIMSAGGRMIAATMSIAQIDEKGILIQHVAIVLERVPTSSFDLACDLGKRKYRSSLEWSCKAVWPNRIAA